MKKSPTYKHIKVKLTGEDNRGLPLLERTIKALEDHDVHPDEIRLFKATATSSGYENLVATVKEWVTVD